MQKRLFSVVITIMLLLNANANAKSDAEYKTACNANEVKSCHILANLYIEGLTQRKEYPPKAIELYNKACEGGYIESCNELISYYRDVNDDDEKSRARTAYYSQLACNLKNADACLKMGSYYEYGYGINENIQQAKEYYQKACELGEQTSCDLYKKLLDEAKTNVKYELACNNNDFASCDQLARHYSLGLNQLNKDPIKAIELYHKACEGNYARSCNSLGYLYDNNEEVPRDSKKALALYTKACGLNYATACFNIGYNYEHGDIEKNLQKSQEYYQKGCKLGDRESCNAYNAIISNDQAEMLNTKLALACDANDFERCFTLANRYQQGIDGLKTDKQKARQLYLSPTM